MKEYIIPDDFLDYETKASADGQGYLRELVRCGECKHRKQQDDFCEKLIYFVHDDFYCYFGKRKDGAE